MLRSLRVYMEAGRQYGITVEFLSAGPGNILLRGGAVAGVVEPGEETDVGSAVTTVSRSGSGRVLTDVRLLKWRS